MNMASLKPRFSAQYPNRGAAAKRPAEYTIHPTNEATISPCLQKKHIINVWSNQLALSQNRVNEWEIKGTTRPRLASPRNAESATHRKQPK